MRKRLYTMWFVSFLSLVSSAGIVSDLIGGLSSAGLATMYNQVLEHAQLLQIYQQSIKDVELARNRLAIMVENQKKLARDDSWRGRQEINKLLNKMRVINEKGRHLTSSIATFDDVYAEMVIGKDEYQDLRKSGVRLSDVFEQRGDRWTSAMHDSLHSSGKLALLHREHLGDSGERLREAKTSLYDAGGTMQALQAIGEITAASTAELQQLGSLMAANLEMMTNIHSRQLDQDANSRALMDTKPTEFISLDESRRRGLEPIDPFKGGASE